MDAARYLLSARFGFRSDRSLLLFGLEMGVFALAADCLNRDGGDVYRQLQEQRFV